MTPTPAEEPSLSDLFLLLKRGLWISLAVAVTLAAITFFLSRAQPPTYQAEVILLASQPSADLGNFGISLVTAPPIDPSSYQTIALSTPVLNDARHILGGAPLTEKQLSVSVEGQLSSPSSLINIEATDHNAARAAAIANAVGQALLNWDVKRASQNLSQIVATLEQQVTNLSNQIRALQSSGQATQDQINGLITLRAEKQSSLSSARALSTSAIGLLDIVEPATAPKKPVAPNPKRYAAIAFVLGLFLSYGVLLFRNALDTRIRGSEELDRQTALLVLAEFPDAAKAGQGFREATGYLRTSLTFAGGDTYPKVFLVTSTVPDGDKSRISLNLASSFARGDHRTLLVDADLRQPTLSALTGLDGTSTPPLYAYLSSQQALKPAYMTVSKTRQLDIIPSHTVAAAPTELLDGFKGALEAWREHYDIIVIDAAPLLTTADTLAIAPLTTGVVVAVNLQQSDRRNIREALALLPPLGARVLGLVTTEGSKPLKRSNRKLRKASTSSRHPVGEPSKPA